MDTNKLYSVDVAYIRYITVQVRAGSAEEAEDKIGDVDLLQGNNTVTGGGGTAFSLVCRDTTTVVETVTCLEDA